ncbi:MAG: PCP reductase family protein [Thermodesulfobacteriota bacterium]
MDETTFKWTDEAEERLSKVPEGFMRNMTKKRIEEHARANSIVEITFDVVQEAIESSRAGMGSMMGGDMSGMPEHVKKMMSPEAEIPEQKEPAYYFCFVCNYAVPETIPDKCPNCNSGSDKFSVLEKEYRTEAHTVFLTWSAEANKYLDSIPEGFRREMAKNEIEAFSRRNGYKVVTRKVTGERLKVWGDISKKIVSEMKWEKGVKERVDKIPERIRGMVVKEMELFARRAGEDTVTLRTLDSIRDKWMGSREFHVKWQ